MSICIIVLGLLLIFASGFVMILQSSFSNDIKVHPVEMQVAPKVEDIENEQFEENDLNKREDSHTSEDYSEDEWEIEKSDVRKEERERMNDSKK